MIVTPLGRVIDLTLIPENDDLPMFVTPLGMVKLLMFVQPVNAVCPINVTVSGIVIFDSWLQLWNV